MKVLLINNSHFIRGGADRVYFNTGRLLEDNNIEVQYFSSNNSNNVDTRYSKYFVDIIDNRKSGLFTRIANVKNYLYNSRAFVNLEKLIHDERPDIAHLQLFYGGLSSSVLKVLKRNNIPVVHTVHDYRLLCPANAFLDSKNRICEKCKNKTYFQCTVKKCLEGNFFYSSILSAEAYTRKYVIDPFEYIDHFLFVSRFSQQKHIEYDSRFANKSSHLYNFTNIPEQNSVSDAGSYFLFFGRLSREKGLLTLLEAAEKSHNNLKIAGTGPMETQIMGYSKISKNIEFLGHQSGDSLIDLIKRSNFVVVPSEWYENNPMAIVEAYSLGKPVIGAKIGGIPEIVVDNKTGFLFESRNSDDLTKVLEKAFKMSSSDYSNMSTNARIFAEINFSPNTHYTELMKIYTPLLKKFDAGIKSYDI